MNAFRKGFGLLALLLLSCLLLSGTAFAKELVVYSSVDEENAKNILDAFSAATGIKVNMIFLSSGPAMSRIEAEKANPQADVWFGAPSENHIVAKGRGLTVPYVPPAAKDLAETLRCVQSDTYRLSLATGNNLGTGTKLFVILRSPATRGSDPKIFSPQGAQTRSRGFCGRRANRGNLFFGKNKAAGGGECSG